MTNEKHIKRYSLSRQVADQLEKMIVDGAYPVGSKIPTEPELTEMFSVSRNTLREAIKSLSSAGILVVKQGDGTYVRSNNRFHARMSMEYENVSLEEIQEARNTLEVAIASLAAQRRTVEDLELLREKLYQRQSTTAQEKGNAQADMEFHIAIANACHNKILSDLYSSISAYLESHIAQRQEETSLDDMQIDMLHENLYAAIRSQDPEQARISAENILKI